MQTFLKEKAITNVSDEDIDSVAGGKSDEEKNKIAMSVITFGVCEIEWAISKEYDDVTCLYEPM